MILKLATRMLTGHDLRLLAKFATVCGWHGMRAVNRFKKRVDRGEQFPAFLFLSITNACNLKCQGCWVTPSCPPRHLDLDLCDELIATGKREGCRFYGLLGGEPLLHPGLLSLLSKHRDCYFQVFTNGTLLTRDLAREFRRLGNVTPLISIEGSETVSDVRRGGEDVHGRTLDGLRHCRAERLITGVACSVCKSNIDDLVTDGFARSLMEMGVAYLWYYVYRPVGPRPTPELALARDQVLELRRFIVDLRTRLPMIIVDAYWDADGNALCPAATGISHHVNPYGEVEPCPIIQFACDALRQGESHRQVFTESTFLRDFRDLASRTTRGCIVMEAPAKLREFLEAHWARDTTGRGTGPAELASICPCNSHNLSGDEIPERHWLYRFAKRHWFFGFGAYG